MKQLIACRTCGAELTPLLSPVVAEFTAEFVDESDAVPLGRLWASSGASMEAFAGHHIANLADARVERFGDLSGCCGVSGDGPNLACALGHAVGTERSDCWTPRFAAFAPEHTVVASVVGEAARRIVFIGRGRGDAVRLVTLLNERTALPPRWGRIDDVLRSVAVDAIEPIEVAWVDWRLSQTGGMNPRSLAADVARFGPGLQITLT